VRILIIRHAIAVPPGTPGIPDDERPLTPAGEKRFRRAAKGLARITKRPHALLTSPLPRALRTAEIAAEAWGRIRPKKTQALVGGSLEALEAALKGYPAKAEIALVGHEPHVSALLAHLVGSTLAERLVFRKGGAALVDVPGSLSEGGRLVFYLAPKILRALAD
jgi:phosphohistidine phosphatase